MPLGIQTNQPWSCAVTNPSEVSKAKLGKESSFLLFACVSSSSFKNLTMLFIVIRSPSKKCRGDLFTQSLVLILGDNKGSRGKQTRKPVS